MQLKIGIPRGMFYYDYFLLWKEFFNNLGAEVIISPRTNKAILNRGIHACVDEACLPVKIFHGHVDYLKGKVDYIFIPKIISLYKREYCCPKHLGLPDMVRYSLDGLPEIIDTEVNLIKSNGSLKKSVLKTGRYFTNNSRKILKAFDKAYNQFEEYRKLMRQGIIPINSVGFLDTFHFNITEKKEFYKRKILILGHSYNVYDEYTNMNLVRKLNMRNIKVITTEMIDDEIARHYASKLPKRMFWTHGQRIVGGAFHLIDTKSIDGIVYVSAFGCGLDSVLMDLVERKARENHVPYTLLTIDEHTGEAGMNTRIEAFIDMLEWRDKNETNFSTHG
ncbi:acyl-CoA dehydratase activase-related protein [Tepidimicrobium xylanilyticum]|uniref:Predicted nucleotide-binding protein, sugar kinase/HSP70/actin superfamily n=1 Tax=Tepidimicrobium xylanilyticum TaxID=1123352 RepID=A0A1H2U0B6_9FIRM|nr:acyl-CoA dehydratase activase-related protein [Tepidimicrobium xylanilyticum]GMG98065.1 2-hydroxyglutaryl-CoA dehydratase [Tepidimicrobium xylanilyticum]SDW49418.1 Predicted nucleotide-binding protein, sugar kinase/HSP70/actin superfamily [Tepidimicrobium xylanilyticum]